MLPNLSPIHGLPRSHPISTRIRWRNPRCRTRTFISADPRRRRATSTASSAAGSAARCLASAPPTSRTAAATVALRTRDAISCTGTGKVLEGGTATGDLPRVPAEIKDGQPVMPAAMSPQNSATSPPPGSACRVSRGARRFASDARGSSPRAAFAFRPDQRFGGEELFGLLARDVAQLERHFAEGLAAGERALDDLARPSDSRRPCRGSWPARACSRRSGGSAPRRRRRPRRISSVNAEIAFGRIWSDCSRLCATSGIMTFNSSCPACTASEIAASFPTTWNPTIASISGMTGLTLPGMIEDPGCSAGRRISPKPVTGPEFSRRKSLPMRMHSSASALSAPERIANGARLCVASNRSGAGWSSSAVRSRSRRTTSSR